ncbi:MAG: M48 family metallopeptidase [Oscillospiraceae bacterium]|nr:M48 family metallopeptidase [Oscillospiraceae bacterium]
MTKRIHIIEKGKNWSGKQNHSLNIQDIAHPVDKTLIKVLETAHVRDILNVPLEQLVSANFGQMLSTGIPLDNVNFPQLYDLMQSTCKRLGIQIPYTVITNQLAGINAFATGTDNRAFIVVSSMAAEYLQPKELQFIVSHECGHIAMQHMVYHTAGSLAAIVGGYVPLLGPVLAQTAVFPLNCWNRCSEITADRIGLICCEDLRASQMALLRIVGGFTDISEIDIDRYIVQSHSLQNTQFLGKLGEYFQTHPMIYKRLRALEYFYHSKMYYQAVGKSVPMGVTLLDDVQLHKATNELLKIL